MNNHAMFLLHMCHVHFPDPSGVRRLSAALRVKSGLGKFHLKSVKIIQADGRQDTPAKPIPHHFLAGIDAVDLEIPSDAGQSTRFEPGEKLGI